MNQKNKERGTWHLTAIVVLSVLFITVMFVSTSNVGVEKYVDFKKTILVSTDNLDNFMRVDIGEFTVTNDGFLSARVEVPRYFACHFREGRDPISVNIELGGMKTSSSNNAFEYNRYEKFVDVKAGETLRGVYRSVDMYPYFNYREDTFTETFDLENLKFYIFENNQMDYYSYYSRCDEVTVDEAVYEIDVEYE